MTRLDWDKARRRDLVRERGGDQASEPMVDVPRQSRDLEAEVVARLRALGAAIRTGDDELRIRMRKRHLASLIRHARLSDEDLARLVAQAAETPRGS